MLLPAGPTHDNVSRMQPVPKKVRVLVIEDHVIFRQGLVEILNNEKDLTVVGETSRVDEAIPILTGSKPDVLVLELRLPGEDGLHFLPRVPKISESTRCVVLSNSNNERDVVESARLGARGYLLKSTPTAQVLSCIRAVAGGQIWMETQHMEMILTSLREGGRRGSTHPLRLSRREKDVVSSVLCGLRNKEIAAELNISEKTVKNHLSKIFDKLGVSDRLELALYVLDKKLLSEPTESE